MVPVDICKPKIKQATKVVNIYTSSTRNGKWKWSAWSLTKICSSFWFLTMIKRENSSFPLRIRESSYQQPDRFTVEHGHMVPGMACFFPCKVCIDLALIVSENYKSALRILTPLIIVNTRPSYWHPNFWSSKLIYHTRGKTDLLPSLKLTYTPKK